MELEPIYSSNMVFAAGKPILIRGRGTGIIRISLAWQEQTVTAQNGLWSAEFQAMEYGGPYTVCVEGEGQYIQLENVYVGEVYLVAGQSNVQIKMKETSTDLNEYTGCERLRLFTVDRLMAGEHFSAADGWQVCRAEDVPDWSAVGYLTGKEIVLQKGIAVGIIACYQGGSVIESWLPRGTCERLGIHIPPEEKHEDHTQPDYLTWNADGRLYEYQLSQVKGIRLTGVIWYQGESDCSPAEAPVYEEELAELIRIWRTDFRDPTLPFAVVQIADYLDWQGADWSMIQQAQLHIQERCPYVRTVISRDVCENDDIHPKTKIKLAKRIAETLIHGFQPESEGKKKEKRDIPIP